MKERPKKMVERDKFIHMRLTEKEYAELEIMSRDLGCTKTEFVCALIRCCYDTSLYPADIYKIVDDYKQEKKRHQISEYRRQHLVDEYCRNDMLATEAAFNAMQIRADMEAEE